MLSSIPTITTKVMSSPQNQLSTICPFALHGISPRASMTRTIAMKLGGVNDEDV